ncbi:MAG TPA: glycosyl hydrolase family 65 protein, partial [Candidatus Dormibacteraeota bacterium]|nr:glycosyl hydrolase family 65 protein [Candidatus Dormibacteraeota bacterium]
FWDSESFVLPVLTYTAPQAAGDALRWRHATLPGARERARVLGLAGASFPWRTITGAECSSYWPAGTAAFHINADVADAVLRYHAATGDDQFQSEVGVELLVETARLWLSLGHHDKDGAFRIDGVTGPDEYSAIADNNVYTNLMAQRNLRGAASEVAAHPDQARQLGVSPEETAAWRDAADRVVVPYDEALGVHPQADGFTQHQRWNFEATGRDHYPLLLHFPYFDLYRKQVIKQADLVLALHLRGDAFSSEEKARDFAYYEGLTVRDSSLSACTQSIIAAEVGLLELAYDYLGEAATMDLRDLEHDTRDGMHMAALAGSWLAVVAGLGGMRDHDGRLSFAPRLPAALTRVCFKMVFQGSLLLADINAREVTYRVLRGPALQLTHEGEALTVEEGKPLSRRIHPPDVGEHRPTQPPGRAPASRRRVTS